ncbi:SH3 domain-binding protein 5-like [Dreissena polymorpha]|uniref:SH3 domain-binding protein 5 n=1 Tax=Dreissena polymorpha TaxID=45954 RepID=A0A9D4FBV4_DREPO|nr:SH3 domain-binding protein 5-like [Dreissena polymorpha]XP_052223449.1 SH3 domain-binding protein 5-like [Dreissena polymorpha]XP_052223450.1 SH3 domain-binding protein 5-like [Dreissena polymorpha]XP_052223451.1 SH3 domain-binding protein 5-like [Dreissena polymorpha]XP_052223452.1 SH3 domain-binding protein 5-like [Dreissena polymorpha]XP_052223453.1 SH3 domain-binding protein 5-like [Dreissena polymorpha]KAH3795998.1 hypothetical protein DPMN_149562 [Dreissena polymorpha]
MENAVIEDDIPDGDSDEESDDIDPRIQAELNQLNLASSEINRLENELDEARTKYRTIVSGASLQMDPIAKDQKRCIQKSREYYKTVAEAKVAQSEALKAARQFQTAMGIYKAAKETVALAERRLCEEEYQGTTQLTSAWQETLNHAVSKIMDAEREKTRSEQEHKQRSKKFAELESRLQVLEKKYSRSIKKARPYFELKSELDVKLMQQKQNVIDLQAAIRCQKQKYTSSLRKLESISEEIHQHRNQRLWAKIPRMPGVGSDGSIDSTFVDLESLNSGCSDTVDDFETESDLSRTNSTSDYVSDIMGDLELSAEAGPSSNASASGHFEDICLSDSEKMGSKTLTECRRSVNCDGGVDGGYNGERTIYERVQEGDQYRDRNKTLVERTWDEVDIS